MPFGKIIAIAENIVSDPKKFAEDLGKDLQQQLIGELTDILASPDVPEVSLIAGFAEVIIDLHRLGRTDDLQQIIHILPDTIVSKKNFAVGLLAELKKDLPLSAFEEITGLLVEAFLSAVGHTEKFIRALMEFVINSGSAFLSEVDTFFTPVMGAVIDHSETAATIAADTIIDFLSTTNHQINRVTADAIGLTDKTNSFSSFLFEQQSFMLSKATWVVSLFLNNLLSGVDLLREGSKAMGDIPVVSKLFKSFIPDSIKVKIRETLAMVFITVFIEKAKNDRDAEWALLQIARFTPVGVILIIIATLHCALDFRGITKDKGFFIDLIARDIEAKDSGYAVKRLPQTVVKEKQGGVFVEKIKNKYLILSDIHRDDRADKRAMFQHGSVDHFLYNATLYLRVLNYADRNGYTVIEAGDCEELWFHNDFSKRPTEKLRGILDTHKEVYNKLRELHRKKRYFRTYGNHDSYLRDPETRKVLDDFFGNDFEIYDFIVIDGVKTMQGSITDIRLGLDSAPYTERAPMIVTHGHHWDFWNCDRNNIIGKLIVSAVGTPIDMIDDIIQDIGGISRQGSPMYNFNNTISDWFIFDSWPTKHPAKRKAHAIEHQEDESRKLVDSIMYSETLTTLLGTTLGVKTKPEDGSPLFCIGHTHNPQAQPYIDILDFIPIPLLKTAKSKIDDTLPFSLTEDITVVKSDFFNSGVAGWMDGIVWAIDIGEYGGNTGQPKLIFWDEDNLDNKAQTMDWQLSYIEDDRRIELNKLPVTKLMALISDLPDMLSGSIRSNTTSSISFGALLEEIKQLKNNTIDIGVLSLGDQLKSIQLQFVKALAALLSKSGDAAYSVRMKIEDAVLDHISFIKPMLRALPFVNDNDLDRAALVWIYLRNNIGALTGRGASTTHSPAATLSLLSLLAFLMPKDNGLLGHDMSIQNGTLSFTFKAKAAPKRQSTDKDISLRTIFLKHKSQMRVRRLASALKVKDPIRIRSLAAL